MNCSIDSKDRLKQSIVLLVLICILNPFIGMICSLIILLKNKDQEINYINFYVTCALWISLVNSTKIPDGDLVNYINYFRNVPNKTVLDNILNWDDNVSKEPLYGIYNYISYYITLGNERFFLFMTSFIDYLLLYVSLTRVYRKGGIPKSGIVCGLLAITFFTQLFTLSLHLIRQILATSIFIYALSFQAVEHKKRWLLMIVAMLIHTSTVLLVILSLIPGIYSYIKAPKLFLILAGFTAFLSFGTIFSTAVGITSIGVLDYGLQRFGNSVADLTDGVSPVILLLIIVPGIVICFFTLRTLKKRKNKSPLYPFVYLFIFLSAYVLSFFKMPLMQYRSFMLMYPLIPFIYPILFTKSSNLSNIYWILISVGLFFRFLMTYNYSPFRFAPISKIILSPILGYLY